ncbi:hypothetical protein [Mariniflexile sp. AS56]|uniref:hypothetical protein n=1 Tax=Mariniflexile sp. AS56 TaxID=3063957 RepID=UPI0026F1FFBF|nr:hypothetical protein [Mariniflexile sp. AS56]MDO7170911.1 hypothetical protein [Mariniflexile sp. AS56]
MLRPFQPYIEYALNQEYIAEFLCVNTDKPELQCQGSCYLLKQVKKQQKNEPVSLRILLENYPIGFVDIMVLQLDKSITTNIKHCFLYSKLYQFRYYKQVFPPPKLA